MPIITNCKIKLTFLDYFKTVAFLNADARAEWLRFVRISLGDALFYPSAIGVQAQALPIDCYEKAAAFRGHRPRIFSKNSRWHSG